MRLVVASKTKDKFFGEYEGTKEDLINELLRGQITLKNVWTFLVLDMPRVNQQSGQVSDVGRWQALMPLDSCMTRLKTLMVDPAYWYDVDSNGLTDEFDKMVREVEKSMMQARAQKADIIPASVLSIKGGRHDD